MPGNPYKQRTLILSKHLCIKVTPYQSQRCDVWIECTDRTDAGELRGKLFYQVDNNNLGDLKDLIDAAVAHNLRVEAERDR